jgi:cob(I)alamin adenosyltransferase
MNSNDYTPKAGFFIQSGYNSGMSPLYNGRGDDGTTGWLGEGRLPKHHPRIEALGTLDEASAALGLARALARDSGTGTTLIGIQRDLYAMMSEVAASPEQAGQFRKLDSSRVEWLESLAEALQARTGTPGGFILPGDSPGGAALSLARTIVRRAERRIAELLDRGELSNRVLLQYLNRLSSLCFALELLENQAADQQTKLAKG